MTAMTAALGHGHVKHQCCWYVDGDTPCGLWCGHDGDHTPHEIGAYLTIATPIIHPLDMLRLNLLMRAGQWSRLRCPLCGAGPDGPYDGFSLTLECEGLVSRYCDGEGSATYERDWRFGPCGCEGRELLTNPGHDSS